MSSVMLIMSSLGLSRCIFATGSPSSKLKASSRFIPSVFVASAPGFLLSVFNCLTLMLMASLGSFCFDLLSLTGFCWPQR